MAGSVNKVILVGNLGRDPEIRSTQSGARIGNFSMATSDIWNDKASGERRERTEWHRVVVMNDRILDFVEKYVRKGDKVYVEGSLQTRKWTDQSGVEKYSTEVVVGFFGSAVTRLDSASGGGERAAPAREPRRADERPSWERGGSSERPGAVGGGFGADLDDEIPFAPPWQ